MSTVSHIDEGQKNLDYKIKQQPYGIIYLYVSWCSDKNIWFHFWQFS